MKKLIEFLIDLFGVTIDQEPKIVYDQLVLDKRVYNIKKLYIVKENYLISEREVKQLGILFDRINNTRSVNFSIVEIENRWGEIQERETIRTLQYKLAEDGLVPKNIEDSNYFLTEEEAIAYKDNLIAKEMEELKLKIG